MKAMAPKASGGMGSSRVCSWVAASRFDRDDDMGVSLPGRATRAAADTGPPALANVRASLSTDLVHRPVHNTLPAHRVVWTTVWGTGG
ncbi:hypothetical protein GCM10027517_29550 [Phycicoccus ginsengisoli]